MNILVTGGGGFIGRHLVEKICKNHNITIYDNLSNSSLEKISFLLDKVNFINGDVLDFEKILENSKNFDVVIHLAAKSDVTESIIHPDDTINVNLNGTKNVLRCCVQNKIKKIIFASSAAVYGDHDDIISEKSITKPLSPYGKSKLDAENEIIRYGKENNLQYCMLRIFNVYGKGQNDNYAGVITRFLKNISDNKPLVIYGDGKQTRDFVSVYDVVDAFECAILSKDSETYNIASGNSISINELVDIILDSYEKKIETIYREQKKGDIKNSAVDVTFAKNSLGFVAKKKLADELARI
ncbi:MAG: NAD-dependent epimerase/dehydratase family protein [Nitrosarchaeum sp.]|nr:NAD-dependent epimerase/dehydratase family protein [Nitrosarchaeum sp.]